jgi:hypothetical protein
MIDATDNTDMLSIKRQQMKLGLESSMLATTTMVDARRRNFMLSWSSTMKLFSCCLSRKWIKPIKMVVYDVGDKLETALEESRI